MGHIEEIVEIASELGETPYRNISRGYLGLLDTDFGKNFLGFILALLLALILLTVVLCVASVVLLILYLYRDSHDLGEVETSHGTNPQRLVHMEMEEMDRCGNFRDS